jgi:hypothetical protein
MGIGLGPKLLGWDVRTICLETLFGFGIDILFFVMFLSSISQQGFVKYQQLAFIFKFMMY